MVADTPQSPPPSIAPSTIPTTRLENEHLPAVPSPLNPRTRVERDKRASLKKREAGGDGIGETQGPSKKQKKSLKKPTHLSPIRYHLPLPKSTDFDAPKAPTFMPTVGKEEWMDSSEQWVKAQLHLLSRQLRTAVFITANHSAIQGPSYVLFLPLGLISVPSNTDQQLGRPIVSINSIPQAV